MSGFDKATIRPGKLHYRTSLEGSCIKKKKKKEKERKKKEKREREKRKIITR